MVCLWKRTPCMLLKSPGKVLEKSLNKRLSNLYEPCIRQQLLRDFEQFARRMRLQYIFHGQNKEPHPFHVKSQWMPPVQPSIALESYLEHVKIQLAEITLTKPNI